MNEREQKTNAREQKGKQGRENNEEEPTQTMLSSHKKKKKKKKVVLDAVKNGAY